MKMHQSITLDRITEACYRRMTTLDNPGFCVNCGHESNKCEPDARKYHCDNCGLDTVYGSDELLFEIA